MKVRTIPLIFTVFMFFLQGCGVGQQLGQAYNLTQCKYDYRSVSQLTLSGMDFSKGINVLMVPQVIALLTSPPTSVPLDMTINLDVTNPNQTAAALHGLDYILKIDNVEFTRGALNQSLNIASGSTQVLPLRIGFDLATLLSGNSKNAVENIVKNLIGIGNEKSTVSLQIRPSFRIGGKTVPSPQYIPVNFSFGGK